MGRIDFNEVQFPVGQGGFHMGWLRYHGVPLNIDLFVGAPPFAWAYDCGSDQTSALNTQIQSIDIQRRRCERRLLLKPAIRVAHISWSALRPKFGHLTR